MRAAEVCERLAGLARAGYPVRKALIELPTRLDDASGSIVSAARRASLGAPVAVCIEPLSDDFGDAISELGACLDRSTSSGADWAAALDELAGSLRERASLRRSAEVAGAGATLSARIIAALPLLMLPTGLRQATDAVVATSMGLGLMVGVLGYRWLLRVVPSPPPDDRSAVIADEVAAFLDAGRSLDSAVERAVLAWDGLVRPLRRARLGCPWRVALAADMPELAVAIADAERTGIPVADALRRTAVSLRRDARQRFERQVQRAPVKMVVPLVLCCLPAFVLIAIVPLLRGLSQPV